MPPTPMPAVQMEAPPAVMSMYLGGDMTEYLEKYKNGATGSEYTPSTKPLDFGTSCHLRALDFCLSALCHTSCVDQFV